MFLFNAIKQTGDFSRKADGGNDSARLTQHKLMSSHARYVTVDDFPLTMFSSPTMHLLTLDPTTLFYWNISEIHNPLSQRRPSINEWASKITGDTRPPSMRTISSGIPALTHSKTTLSQPSVPTSKRSALSANVGIRQPDGDDDLVGGLSDHDETQGRERDELQRAPKKAGKRTTYNVSFSTFWSSLLQIFYLVSGEDARCKSARSLKVHRC